MKNLSCMTLLLLTCYSCQSPKSTLIDQYNEMYNYILHAEDEKLSMLFNEKSKRFFEEIKSKDNQSKDQLIALGKKYNIPYFCLKFYIAFSEDRAFSTDELIQFMIVEQISIFNYKQFYELLEKETGVRDGEGIVALTYDMSGLNKLEWLRYDKMDDGSFKWDLLYSLQLHEKKYRNLYNTAFDNKKPQGEFVEFLYDFYAQEERNFEFEQKCRASLKEMAKKQETDL